VHRKLGRVVLTPACCLCAGDQANSFCGRPDMDEESCFSEEDNATQLLESLRAASTKGEGEGGGQLTAYGFCVRHMSHSLTLPLAFVFAATRLPCDLVSHIEDVCDQPDAAEWMPSLQQRETRKATHPTVVAL
jgi:hypothetical protein